MQPLPPTYAAHLDGLPGFTATVDYTVTAIASKSKNIKLGIGVTCVSFSPFLSAFCVPKRKLGLSLKKPANAQDRLDAVHLLPPRSTCEGDPAAPGAGKNQPRPAIDLRVANARKPNRGADSGVRIIVSERHHLQSSAVSFARSLNHSDFDNKDLYPRVARAVHAPRDPVPYHVHGARARLGNSPQLPALAHGRPRVLADSGAATSQRRCKVRICFP